MNALDFIQINSEDIYRPPEFVLTREDVYKGDYTTCTGKLIADRVGWKYADMTLKWDALPQSMVDVLIDMAGQCSLAFDGMDGAIHFEPIVRTSVVGLRHRYTTPTGEVIWKDVSVSIRFINTHTEV